MARSRGNRGPTLADVARLAGVSVSTASRVIRNHPDVRVETKDRVSEVIARLGYYPSGIARALVTGRANLLALLVNDITNPFYPALARAVEREARQHGYLVAVCNTEDRLEESRRYIGTLLQNGLDGVIHASVGDDEAEIMSLLSDARRIVFANRRPASASVSYVVSDNQAGATELTRHLLSQGHRRIGFVAGPSFASNARDRLAAHEAAMAEVPGAEMLIAWGDATMKSGARAVADWLDAGVRLDAIVAINDSVALGAFEALVDRRVRLPDDVELAGFDGLTISKMMNIVSVEQRIEDMGILAVQTLLAQLDTSPDTFHPVHTVLPTRLVPRRDAPSSRSTR